MIRHGIVGLLLIGLFLVIVGCGPQGRALRVEFVEGVITLDGQPVSDASVTFIPKNEEDGTEAAGGFSNADGVFRLTSMNGDPERGAVAGEYRVTVSKIEINDPTAGLSEAEAAALAHVPTTQHQVLPAIYQDRVNTPLSYTVNRGRNRIDIELSSNP